MLVRWLVSYCLLVSWLTVVKSVRLVKLVSVHFFHIWTSKSGLNPSVFLHFCLGNVLRTKTACTFSTSERQKVVRTCRALHILTWKCASRHNGVHFFDISTSKTGLRMVFWHFLTSKCASRHNGVQFFIFRLASWLRTRRFSEVTFRPSGAPNHWKNTANRDFPTFSRTRLFLLLILIFSLLDFSSLTLPNSAFPSLHIVGSLTSKLPLTLLQGLSTSLGHNGTIERWCLIWMGDGLQALNCHRSTSFNPKKTPPTCGPSSLPGSSAISSGRFLAGPNKGGPWDVSPADQGFNNNQDRKNMKKWRFKGDLLEFLSGDS